jgi:serine/threonine protein kinase
LLKIAASKEKRSFDRAESYPAFESYDELFHVTWDLSKDYNLEMVPQDIARCLRYAQLAQKKNQVIFPSFGDFSRAGMLATIKMETLPV